MKNRILPPSFYLRSDVRLVARALIGKVLVTVIDGQRCAGIITETEAYEGVTDKASHAWGGKRTDRTEIMYREGGNAYVYLCYGIHSLFNVVTNVAGIPHAVLIRALYPLEGIAEMQRRIGRNDPPEKICLGPGKLSKAMGIHYSDTGTSLASGRILIEDHGFIIPESLVSTGKRIGVDYAGAHAEWPYRYFIRGNKVELTSLSASV
jgi:DNA-3-methyladenine glycosylase